MSGGDELEDRVAEFLELRETTPGLAAEEFAARHPAMRDALLAAIGRAVDAGAALSAGAPAVPPSLGPWRVLRAIGRGGMGVVLAAEHSETGERAAVKCIPWAGIASARSRERFRREAQAVARLRHPGIVSVRDSGEQEGVPWLALELVDGEPLSALAGRVDARATARLGMSIADALAAAHAAGVVHRDLKPDNVLVRTDGEPVILDFGLAALAEDGTLTSSGELLGTPRWMSPEQALGHAADARADVHALGSILFELLAGSPLRDEATRSQLLAAVARGATPRVARAIPGVDRGLAAIVESALAWRPARRTPTAEAVRDDLDRWLAGKPVHARPLGALDRGIEFVVRRPVAASTAGASFVAIVALVAAAPTWLEQRAAREAARAALAADRAAFAWARDAEAPQPEAAEGSPAAEILAARAREREKDVEGAIRLLTAASQRLPSSLAVADERARLLVAARRNAEAIDECERALALAPEDAELWHRLSRSLLRETRNEEAEAAARKADAFATPPDPTIRNTLAATLDALGRGDEAREVLRGVVETWPDRPAAHYNLAFSLDRAMRPAEALPHYRRCIELDPRNVPAAIAVAWMQSTSDDPSLRDVEAGETLLLETLRRDGGRTTALVKTAAEIARRTGRPEAIGALLDELSEAPGLDPRVLGELVAARRSIERSGGADR